MATSLVRSGNEYRIERLQPRHQPTCLPILSILVKIAVVNSEICLLQAIVKKEDEKELHGHRVVLRYLVSGINCTNCLTFYNF